MTADSQDRPWLPALAPYVERDDLRVPLAVPIHLPGGPIVLDVQSVLLRFPRWTGDAFADDFGKKAAGMIDLDGEHLFAEMAVLRLLERDGWQGRWVVTQGGKGEVSKFLTEWKDVPRAEQKNRPIEEAEPRQILARVAGMNKPARYTGCWDVFAWRGEDYLFVQTGRVAKSGAEVKKPQIEWLRAALYLGDPRLRVKSFCFVQWDYR
ncbi:MAG TPA: hypothetical protein VF263_26180 [Longimicrobiaceae bacterium]